MLAPEQARDFWRVPRRWPGETVFIVGGGPSVLSYDLERLRGRHVIAINSSYQAVPFADYLIFSDERWWDGESSKPGHRDQVRASFAGEVVVATVRKRADAGLMLKRKTPPGLALDCDTVAVNFTSFTPAINLGVHLVGRDGRLVLLGADGKLGPGGRSHHHAPHPWAQVAGHWEKQIDEAKTLVLPLQALGIECVNASPGSAWQGIFPIVEFEAYL